MNEWKIYWCNLLSIMEISFLANYFKRYERSFIEKYFLNFFAKQAEFEGKKGGECRKHISAIEPSTVVGKKKEKDDRVWITTIPPRPILSFCSISFSLHSHMIFLQKRPHSSRSIHSPFSITRAPRVVSLHGLLDTVQDQASLPPKRTLRLALLSTRARIRSHSPLAPPTTSSPL